MSRRLIATGSYLVLAKLLPSPSTSVGKDNVVLSDSNTIRIDYVDSAGIQHYLYGNSVSKGAWHTIDVSESIGAGTGAITLKVDGTTNASGANLDLGQTGVGSVMIGAPYSPPNAGTTGHLYVDDMSTTGTTVQSGQIPWHPHKSVRLSAGLSASVDLADGHVDVAADDLSIPARGPALTLGHVWDSALAQAGMDGYPPFGQTRVFPATDRPDEWLQAGTRCANSCGWTGDGCRSGSMPSGAPNSIPSSPILSIAIPPQA